MLDNVTPDGHVFCADAFLNYRTAGERSLLHPGDRYVVAAAGAAAAPPSRPWSSNTEQPRNHEPSERTVMTEQSLAVDPQFRERVVDTVCILLPDVLKRDVSGAGEGTTLMEDLGMSSTGALEIVLLLEENLEVEISVEDLGREHFETVGTLADYVAGNVIDED
ncbi:phosphopantetheine-binding protein [Catenulispora yoronensis]